MQNKWDCRLFQEWKVIVCLSIFHLSLILVASLFFSALNTLNVQKTTPHSKCIKQAILAKTLNGWIKKLQIITSFKNLFFVQITINRKFKSSKRRKKWNTNIFNYVTKLKKKREKNSYRNSNNIVCTTLLSTETPLDWWWKLFYTMTWDWQEGPVDKTVFMRVVREFDTDRKCSVLTRLYLLTCSTKTMQSSCTETKVREWNCV